MIMIYCSPCGLRCFYKESALLLRSSSPLRTAPKRMTFELSVFFVFVLVYMREKAALLTKKGLSRYDNDLLLALRSALFL